ncbi:ferritin-like domain-containing protein [Candidatus Entotheonella palauensis]|uniref:ferritin-like domain-containing protein n=1 Tax=Candidatus Entotheonella palauensis TaxID=93172 RepID=UPI000B7F3765|nr:ferritin-like domain-containing protein [Candidatus Entotheonella palauensis]
MKGIYRFTEPSTEQIWSFKAAPESVAEAARFFASATQVALERPEPPMQPRDEFVFYLQTAAEIEHTLMLQYLYAAYSLAPDNDSQDAWRDTLIEIAREEMGHLMSVQNLLHAVGGPIRFDRDDYPFNLFYPFPFELEPFSLKAIAKYVLAEMPDQSVIDLSLGFVLDDVKRDAGLFCTDRVVNRVGLLFARMVDHLDELSDADFREATIALQGLPQHWTLDDLIVETVSNVADAKKLLQAIGEQGEGPDETRDGKKSHFLKFFEIYQAIKANPSAAQALEVPVNPTLQDDTAPGYFTDAGSRAWGALFDTRYRILLAELGHLLVLRREAAPMEADPEPIRRARLRSWALRDMRTLSRMATVLVNRNQLDPPEDVNGRRPVAAPPFTLPYTLTLPELEFDRWRLHRLLVRETSDRIAAVRAADADDEWLERLEDFEKQRLEFIEEQLSAIHTESGSQPGGEQLPNGDGGEANTFVEVGSVSDFAVGSVNKVNVNGEDRVLYHVDPATSGIDPENPFHASQLYCWHRHPETGSIHCELSGTGLLSGNIVICDEPYKPGCAHGSEYDVVSGEVLRGPASRNLIVYETKVSNGKVWVAVNPRHIP